MPRCPFAPTLAIAAALSAAGCTLVGLGVGALIDKSGDKTRPLAGWQIEKVRKGERIHVRLRDGREVAGEFHGTEAATAEYGPRYAAAAERLRPELPLPAIGETVTVTLGEGKTRSGTFGGFEPTRILLVGPSGTDLPLAKVRGVSWAGGAVEGAQLVQVARDGTLPMLSLLVVGTERVPLEQVAVVDVPRHGKAKLVGTLIGAAVDVVLVVAFLSMENDVSTCTYCTSCPFFYSFDGRGYVLDAETFGGALFEAAQRRDRVRLDHLVAAGGAYRLRVTNELQEIQYLDEVKLLVVDAPAGAEVVPSVDGRLHVLEAPVVPSHAADLAGADVLRRVAARDGESWLSDPFHRDPREGRDGLVLEFPRPWGAPAVTLAFRLRSTVWAAGLLRDVLALHGRDLPAWSARMESDAAARGAFLRALRREGLPRVEVWDGSSWREVGGLANLGPVSRDQAVRVDLAGIPGTTLRVRLEATAGMWMVDEARADFGRDAEPRITVLRPGSALTASGRDLRGLLAAADGKSWRMEAGRDAAELVFPAPPLRAGTGRSYVLEATGHYTVLAPAEGDPQEALFERLVNEPGAFGQLALSRLHEQADRAVARLSAGSRGTRE